MTRPGGLESTENAIQRQEKRVKPRRIQLWTPFTSNLVTGRLTIISWLAGSLLTAFGADVFTVDSSQSQISISGNIAGAGVGDQGSGSLTTRYGGSILAAVTGASI